MMKNRTPFAFTKVVGLSVFILLTSVRLCWSEPLNIDDFKTTRITDRSIGQMLYDRFIPGAQPGAQTDGQQYIYAYRYEQKPNLTSSAVTTAYRTYREEKSSHRDLVRSIWKGALSKIRKDIRKRFTEYEEYNPIPVVSSLAQYATPLSQSPSTRLRPELKVGSDFVKPGVTIQNALNTQIDIGTTYHTKERTLESNLFRQIGDDVEFTVRQTNVFLDDEEKTEVLVGFKYQF